MILEGSGPRVYAAPPGIDFAAELVRGLRSRMGDAPPEAMARVELIVNTQRMARRVAQVFQATGAGFLPRIVQIADLADPATAAHLPLRRSDLGRRLELSRLIAGLLEAAPDLAPRAALFDLADSLAQLMDEMQVEGVDPSALQALDVSDQSGHWQRALSFLTIVTRYFDGSDPHADGAALQRLALEARIAAWRAAPPAHPVIVAGSTGSRGTAQRLIRAVAGLPQGAILLPGVDTEMPRHVWDQLGEGLGGQDPTQPGEDHPQYRFARLFADLRISPADLQRWTDAAPPAPLRNRLVSLALRPAPVTDQWLSEGPLLGQLGPATEGLALVSAATRREEALSIALRLREAAEDGTTAALITPDRQLSRQVTAALDRWGIVPDDSAGIPAGLTPPGRFLRQTAQMMAQGVTAAGLVAVLKHPLCHAGAERGLHTRATQAFELQARNKGWPYPDPGSLADWTRGTERADWGAWLASALDWPEAGMRRPLGDWTAAHLRLSETLVAGSAGGTAAPLWAEAAGRAVAEIVTDLVAEAALGTDLTARDYAALFGAILGRGEVRAGDSGHPLIRIWGTLEARVMGADLLVLGGLNEGVWPALPPADPWLNRSMRAAAGLLLPERRIGLQAHDFQQAIAAREVMLTRAARSDDAETVPARWLNRLTNLLGGLPEQGGDAALAAIEERGARWLKLARSLDTPETAPPAPRPAPCPPAAARPKSLSVTQIKTLIRDPYAIYAAKVLHLSELGTLQQDADPLLRGMVMHDFLEDFIRDSRDDPGSLTAPALMTALRQRLVRDVPFPLARATWEARMARIAESFIAEERARREHARPAIFEETGTCALPGLDFSLTARPDRMDLDARGGVWIYDYKTGAVASQKQQIHFDKQLLLEAGMVARGAFAGLGSTQVAGAAFLDMKSGGEVPAPFDKAPPEETWALFERLVTRYLDPGTGFIARRALQSDQETGRFDHLARFGEWDASDPSKPEVLE